LMAAASARASAIRGGRISCSDMAGRLSPPPETPATNVNKRQQPGRRVAGPGLLFPLEMIRGAHAAGHEAGGAQRRRSAALAPLSPRKKSPLPFHVRCRAAAACSRQHGSPASSRGPHTYRRAASDSFGNLCRIGEGRGRWRQRHVFPNSTVPPAAAAPIVRV
jgi:hypothetical protein